MSKTTIEISGDASGFKDAAKDISKNLDGIKKDAEKSAKGSSQAFSTFLGTFSALALQKAFSVAVNGFKSFIGAMGESIELAKVQQEAINELDNSLVRTGRFTREASNDFQAFASQLQSTSKFGDEVILKNAALIQSFGNLSVDGLKQATSASVDLAAALGKDLGTASKILGQAAAGNVAGLSKFGIQIESTGDKAKDFALAVEQINEKFGGAAAAQLNTYDGATTQLGNTYGDLKEILGGVVVENGAVIGAFQGLNTIVQEAQKFLLENRDAVQDFIANGLQKLVGTIPIVASGINIFMDTMTGLEVIFDGVKFVLNETVRGFVNFAQAVVGAADAVASFAGINSETIKSAKASLAELDAVMADTSDGFLRDAQNAIDSNAQKKKAVSDFAEFAKNALDESIQNQLSKTQEELDIEKKKLSDLAAIREAAKIAEDEQKFTDADLFIQNEQEKLDYIRDILGQEEALKEEARARELAATGDHNAARASLDAAASKARKADIFTLKKFEELSQSERLSNMKSTLGTISSLQSSSSKELFAIGKAAAISTATIDGIQAVQKALASAPPPFNIALASIVGIATAANIGKIASAKPPTGAFNGALVEGGSMMRDTEPFMLSRGEIVAPRKSFDEVVEGTARQRGFVKGNESGGKNVTVNIDTLIGQDQFINDMIEKIREKILFENADLGVAKCF